MSEPFVQEERRLHIQTPLGDNELLLTSFSGREEISRLFSYQLDLISENHAISPKDIVGQDVTFSVTLGNGEPRFFNGFVSRFCAGSVSGQGLREYRCEVVPWLWFLTLTTDCRIFQNKTVPEIIEQIFTDLGFSDFELVLQGAHQPWEYCVQYRETDFNFVSRLMEKEGIAYTVRHEEGKHTIVFWDAKSSYHFGPEKEIEFSEGSLTPNHISSWERRYELRPGKVTHTDYNFKTPSTSLMADTKTLVHWGNDQYEIYDFPGAYPVKDDGSELARMRMEEAEVTHDVASAQSNCATLSPAVKFTLLKHDCKSEEATYVITHIEHFASEPGAYSTGETPSGEYYKNTFECIPDAVTFRPARTTVKPTIQGIQTAVVTGPAGEEIYPDEFGRVKVQFHWDREGKKDENSSCWIRASQVHAGKSFGGIDIPRIGEEVIISFEEGDPDRPYIVGRVYNAEVMPPFPLPGKMVVSGMKSNSTKGGGGYNEFVLDDTKGNELIRVHGQFDMDSTIENDLREHVLNDRSRDVTNNETIEIGVDRKETVGNDESLTVGNNRTEEVGVNETLSVGADRTRTVGKNESVTVNLTRTHNVGINESINVGAAQEVTVGGMRAVTVGMNQSVTIGGNLGESVSKNHTTKVGQDSGTDVGGNISISAGKDGGVKIAKKLLIDAGEEITIKTGSASIEMKKDGTINIQGKDITVKGSGKINVDAANNVIIKGQKILEN